MKFSTPILCFSTLAPLGAFACGVATTHDGFGSDRAVPTDRTGASIEGGASANDGHGTAGDGGTSGSSVFAACASSTTTAAALPLYLVFMFDRSGSMKDATKWPACKAGLESFFTTPNSTGLNASIQFFPQSTRSDGDDKTCETMKYEVPLVPMTSLPTTSFNPQLDAIMPNGNTPTLPAISGAILYAQANQAEHPEAKAAVVLVTDGDPNGCTSSVANTATAAQAVASTIPTYVIGVGADTTNLNQIAAAGGTKQAIQLLATDPGEVTSQFEAALATIRLQQLGCNYTVPSAPMGQTIDINQVNVVYTPDPSMPSTTLPYDPTCAGAGWHYDDPTNPTKITVCDETCDALKAAPTSKAQVQIALGCQTQVADGLDAGALLPEASLPPPPPPPPPPPDIR